MQQRNLALDLRHRGHAALSQAVEEECHAELVQLLASAIVAVAREALDEETTDEELAGE